MRFSDFRSRIPIKKFMAGYLAALLVVGAFGTDDPFLIARGTLVVALYAAVDLLWTRVRDRTWYPPLSSFISGLIIANLLSPRTPWVWVAAVPIIAVAGKQLVRWGPRHIFNPAGLALTVVGIFVPGAVSWWGAAWGMPAFAITGVVGLFILWRQKRFHVTLPFLGVYTLGLIVLFLSAGVSAADIPAILRPQLVDGTLIFFATVMLIEPITTSFASKKIRMVYGALVGLLAILASFLSRFIPIPDILIAGMLGGNALVTLATVKRR